MLNMIWRSEVLVREHVVVGTCADSLDHNVLGFVHDVSVTSVETTHFLCVRAATNQIVASSAESDVFRAWSRMCPDNMLWTSLSLMSVTVSGLPSSWDVSSRKP
jgi:hypothetical protein